MLRESLLLILRTLALKPLIFEDRSPYMPSVPIIGVTRAPPVTPRPPRPPRPLPQGVIDHRYRYTLVQRVHCLILMTEGEWPAKIEKKMITEHESRIRLTQTGDTGGAKGHTVFVHRFERSRT
jgi:hypothetical protein